MKAIGSSIGAAWCRRYTVCAVQFEFIVLMCCIYLQAEYTGCGSECCQYYYQTQLYILTIKTIVAWISRNCVRR